MNDVSEKIVAIKIEVREQNLETISVLEKSTSLFCSKEWMTTLCLFLEVVARVSNA